MVAIERLLPGIAEDEEPLAMFIDAARLCGQRSHPQLTHLEAQPSARLEPEAIARE